MSEDKSLDELLDEVKDEGITVQCPHCSKTFPVSLAVLLGRMLTKGWKCSQCEKETPPDKLIFHQGDYSQGEHDYMLCEDCEKRSKRKATAPKR